MKGYCYAAASVALVSAAQLLLRWAMMHLPGFDGLEVKLLLAAPLPCAALAGGLIAYGSSMVCWLYTLHYLPLSRAYPLLSLSYVLVWTGAILLPPFHEVFRWSSAAGIGLILLGLLCVNTPACKK